MSNTQMIIFGISFIFLMTTLGSSIVYFFKKDISYKLSSLILGFASGVMIAASIWSLLIPAIEASESYKAFKFIPAAVGFILGGLFLILIDRIVPHIHNGKNQEEGMKSKLNKSTKLFLAVLIHNIPEGLAVGFAFGAASISANPTDFVAALGLAVGIGLQNLPEGAAISLPMRSETNSKHKGFLYGMGSGIVEPVAGIIGYFLASHIEVLQPWLLSFAAGAMIFVVSEDLIPDAKLEEHPHLGTWGVMIGFVVMMILDVAFS